VAPNALPDFRLLRVIVETEGDIDVKVTALPAL